MASWKIACTSVLVFAVWLWVANDGRLHWDEPAYLYTGAYFNTAEILEAEFQPTGVEAFSIGRILHVLFARLVYSLLGVSASVPGLIIAFYTGLVLASMYVSVLVLRALVPLERWAIGLAVPLTMFAPGYLWLAFKSMPEAPALFFGSLSVLGLVRSMDRRPTPWFLIGAVSLAATALFKATLAWMFGSLAVTLLLFAGPGFPRLRVLTHSLIIGAGSLIIFAATLVLLGFSLEQYLSSTILARGFGAPLVSRLVFTVLEGGLLFAALLLALLSEKRRETYFMLTWFGLATIPWLLVLTYIEPRYLLGNLIPLLGLVALSAEGVRTHVQPWLGRLATRLGAAAAALALVVSSSSAQQILAHEVVTGEVRDVVAELDGRFGSGQYAMVVPWYYTDFHYLRVAYPKLEVYTVYTPIPGVIAPDEDQLKSYYGNRAILSLEEFRKLRGPIVYFGFEESMLITNLRTLARRIPIGGLEQRLDAMIEQVSDQSHFAGSWMYQHPGVEFSPIQRHNYYAWAEVRISAE